MTDFGSDTLTDLERARATAVALEQELRTLQTHVAEAVEWYLEPMPCTCVYEYETNSTEPCERCLAIDWLQQPSEVEMDALVSSRSFDASLLVADCSLDEILREAAK